MEANRAKMEAEEAAYKAAKARPPYQRLAAEGPRLMAPTPSISPFKRHPVEDLRSSLPEPMPSPGARARPSGSTSYAERSYAERA
jgi:hypothetical protein